MHIYIYIYIYIYSAAFLSQAVFSLAWSASVEIMFVHSPNGKLPTCFESRGVPTSRKVAFRNVDFLVTFWSKI